MRTLRRWRPPYHRRCRFGESRCTRGGGAPHAFTTAACLTGTPKVYIDMVSIETICVASRRRCKMVSVKTKSVLVDEINELIGAVGEFDSAEGDAERDYMASTARRVLSDTARRLADARHAPACRHRRRARSASWALPPLRPAQGTASKHVQRLVEAGLVERSPNPGNRKEVVLSLTADGLPSSRPPPHARRDETRAGATSCRGQQRRAGGPDESAAGPAGHRKGRGTDRRGE